MRQYAMSRRQPSGTLIKRCMTSRLSRSSHIYTCRSISHPVRSAMERVFCLVFLLRYGTSMPMEQLILQCQTNQDEMLRLSGSIRREMPSERIFSMDGDLIDGLELNISSIRCLEKSCPTCHRCSKEFESE